MQINSLAVFCGSKSGNNPLYEAAATALGHLLASKKLRLFMGVAIKVLWVRYQMRFWKKMEKW